MFQKITTVVCSLSFMLVFGLSVTHGQETRALVINDPINVAKNYAVVGDYRQASVILEALTSVPGAEKQFYFIEAAMLLAAILIKQEKFDNAKELYQKILVNNPGNTIVRIELAGLYRREGNHTSALFQLELADLSSLPKSVNGRVIEYMQWSRRREGWKFRINFSLMPDTNINSATENETVNIFGRDFDLSDDAQKTSGVGLMSGGGAAYTHSLGPDTFLDAKLDAHYIFYPNNSGFNQGFAMFRLGPRHQITKNNEVSLYFSSSKQTFGGELYSDSYGAESHFQSRLNIKQELQLRVTAQKYKNHFDENRSGARYSGELTFRQYFKERGFLNFYSGMNIDDA